MWKQIAKECGLNPIKWIMALIFWKATQANAQSDPPVIVHMRSDDTMRPFCKSEGLFSYAMRWDGVTCKPCSWHRGRQRSESSKAMGRP